MRNFILLVSLSLITYCSCNKDNGNDPVPPPVNPHDSTVVILPVNHNDIIGWWQGNDSIYNWDGTSVFESVTKYFGTDRFFYQVDGLGQGSSTGKWWWGEKDSLHVVYNDGYQGATIGQNPFYPVTLPKLTKDSMYFKWRNAGWSFKYRHFDSVMISSTPISIIAGTGNQGSTGNEGPAINSLLNHPNLVALDKTGNIYLVDAFNFRLCQITTDGIIHTIAGKSAVALYPADNVPATDTYLGR